MVTMPTKETLGTIKASIKSKAPVSQLMDKLDKHRRGSIYSSVQSYTSSGRGVNNLPKKHSSYKFITFQKNSHRTKFALFMQGIREFLENKRSSKKVFHCFIGNMST